MQISRFTSGGYVIHKALPGQRISAWYDAAGNLLDCERITARGQSRKPSADDVARLRAIGPVYRNGGAQ